MKNINKKIIIAIAAVFLLFISIIIIILTKNEPETPLPGITIDNFSEYFPNTTTQEHNKVFHVLYSQVANSVNESTTIPESGALIRPNSINSYNSYTTAIVDIDSLQLSFLLKIDETNILNDFGVLISCPDQKDIIYQGSSCSIYNEEGFTHAVWDHSYLIDNILRGNAASFVMDYVGEFIVSPTEIATAPLSHDSITYTIKVIESSYTSYSKKSNKPIYSLDLIIDDNRSYKLYVNTDLDSEEDIVAIYVTNQDIQDHSVAAIFNSKDSSLENWIRSLSGDVKIDYKNN